MVIDVPICSFIVPVCLIILTAVRNKWTPIVSSCRPAEQARGWAKPTKVAQGFRVNLAVM